MCVCVYIYSHVYTKLHVSCKKILFSFPSDKRTKKLPLEASTIIVFVLRDRFIDNSWYLCHYVTLVMMINRVKISFILLVSQNLINNESYNESVVFYVKGIYETIHLLVETTASMLSGNWSLHCDFRSILKIMVSLEYIRLLEKNAVIIRTIESIALTLTLQWIVTIIILILYIITIIIVTYIVTIQLISVAVINCTNRTIRYKYKILNCLRAEHKSLQTCEWLILSSFKIKEDLL